MVIAETNRLILRHFQLSDANAMERIFGDPDVMRFGHGTQDSEWCQSWVARCIETYADGKGIGAFAVVLNGKTEPIGYCGLFEYPDICGQPEIEIGYRLARAYWGNGYATEAVLAGRDYAFSELNLPRLIAMIDPQNIASIRVAEKVGMRYEKDVMFDGYDHPDHVYAVMNPFDKE